MARRWRNGSDGGVCVVAIMGGQEGEAEFTAFVTVRGV